MIDPRPSPAATDADADFGGTRVPAGQPQRESLPPRLARACRGLVAGAGVAIALLGSTVLGGWLFDIPIVRSLHPDWVSMKPNAAVSFLFAGIALWLIAPERLDAVRSRAARIFGGLVAATGFLTVAEYGFGSDFRIDQVLFSDPSTAVFPGRMSPIAAVGCSLAGTALLLVRSGTLWTRRLAEAMAALVAGTSFAAIIGYLYGAPELYTVPGYTSMALHTAAGFAALSAAILLIEPERGLVQLIFSRHAGGATARRLLPLAIAGPILLGWLWVAGYDIGLLHAQGGVPLLIAAYVVIFVGAILLNVGSLDRIDRERQQLGEVRRLADTLRQTNRRLETLIRASPLAIVELDCDGLVRGWNPAAERLFGWRAEEVLGGALPTIPSDRMGELQGGLEATLDGSGATPVLAETKRRRKDGTLIDVALWTAPRRDDSGAVIGSIRMLADIGERKQAEVKFRGLLESAPDAMVIADRHGRIALVNAGAEQIFGYSRAEMLGRPVEMLMPERFRAGHVGDRAAYLRGPRSRAMGSGLDLYGLRKDGSEFPVEISLGPIETADGILVSSAIRDSTARKQREAELAKAKTLAEGANRAKSEFLSQMSHELRTPLNAVIGFAQMIELDRDQTLSERQKQYCRHILEGGHSLLELINEILDLSRIESAQVKLSLERVTVRDIFARVRGMMEPLAAQARVTLEVSQAAAVPDIRADELRLRQILLNLVSNAIKYNRPGGSVVVTALQTPAGRVRVVVTDTGIGIPPERQDEVFQPFSLLGAEHTAVEGTGLGLALSRKLAETMGGTIGFSSKPGDGSTFWFELPIASGEAAAAAPVAVEAATPPVSARAAAGGYSLLYIEDNPANLRLMEHLVSTIPDVVMLTAPTPRLGLDLARAHRPDVVVLDLNLPDMDGYEVLSRLKAAPETFNTPVIALTASAMPRDLKKGAAAGFFRYLTKPIDVKMFFAAVDAALSASTPRRGSSMR